MFGSWEIILTSGEGLESLALALNTIINLLKEADILHAAQQTDILGSFFENFLRYGNTSKDLGIVLTPRHICWLAAKSLSINEDDIVYDCSVGTGGFLIAAFNEIRETNTEDQAKKFASKNLFGVEAQARIAVLAFINMYFGGDGKHNLKVDSCFNWQLSAGSKSTKSVSFKEKDAEKKRHNRVTKVLMNPPFSLKDDKEKEPDFIDHGLNQLVDRGILFSVLPSSVLYELKFTRWRRLLLQNHTLKSVLIFPPDLFYPVSTETVGIFIQKGVPHQENFDVLWGRILDDGFIKKKGYRIENDGHPYHQALAQHVKYLKAWVSHSTKFPDISGELEYKPISSPELIPQAHLGTPVLDSLEFSGEIKNVFKSLSTQLWQKLDKFGKL